MSIKEKAESTYNEFLYIMEQIVGNESTSASELDLAGKRLFGSRFRGVYARDCIPTDLKSTNFCIANLDTSSEPGSHWVSIVKLKSGKKLTYDSFGRRVLGKGTDYTEIDAEQADVEENCGARCLAFLCVYYTLGQKYAKFI